MKVWLKNKMKNDIKFIIPDKFLVDIKFKEKLRLLGICGTDKSSAVNKLTPVNIDGIFDFSAMSDDELIDYFNEFGRLSSHDKVVKIGSVKFELYDMRYSYSYSGNKLHLDCKLFYKSPEELYNGKGKFSVDFDAVFEIPDELPEALRTRKCKVSLNIADETINLSHCQANDILSTGSLIAFNDALCNKGMPDNIRIITDGSTTANVITDTSDKGDLYNFISNKIQQASLSK